jgi:hypothetical protein
MLAIVWSLWSIIGLLCVVSPAYSASALPLDTIKLPPGFPLAFMPGMSLMRARWL